MDRARNGRNNRSECCLESEAIWKIWEQGLTFLPFLNTMGEDNILVDKCAFVLVGTVSRKDTTGLAWEIGKMKMVN